MLKQILKNWWELKSYEDYFIYAQVSSFSYFRVSPVASNTLQPQTAEYTGGRKSCKARLWLGLILAILYHPQFASACLTVWGRIAGPFDVGSNFLSWLHWVWVVLNYKSDQWAMLLAVCLHREQSPSKVWRIRSGSSASEIQLCKQTEQLQRVPFKWDSSISWRLESCLTCWVAYSSKRLCLWRSTW